jgi:hypothetical protein
MEEQCDLLRMVNTTTGDELAAGVPTYHVLQRVYCPENWTRYEFSQIVAYTENGETYPVSIPDNDWGHPVIFRLHNQLGTCSFTESETGQITLHF